MGISDKWAIRVGDRLYTGGDGNDIEILIDRSEKGGRNARLLVPQMIGMRLLAEDKAQLAAAEAEAEKKAAAKANPDGEASGEIRKSAFHENDEADFYRDDDEQEQPAAELSSELQAELSPPRIVVFENDEMTALVKRIKGQEKERADRMKAAHEAAQRGRGMRTLPMNRQHIVACLDRLADAFPNLSGAVEFLRCELAIALAGSPRNFRVSPLLLVGEPGIGKTAFCRALAETIGGRFEEFSAGGAQGGFDLCGSSSHWSNAAPGRVFQALAEGDSACPVLLIDEVDKVRGSDQFPVLPILLNLAERDSAARFRDECLGMQFDASKALIVMTANDLSAVPAPLLSRVQVLEVPSPTTEQRRAIAGRMLAELPPVRVPGEALDRLAASDADLREVQRRLRHAVGEVLARGADEVAPDALGVGQWKRRAVGFVS